MYYMIINFFNSIFSLQQSLGPMCMIEICVQVDYNIYEFYFGVGLRNISCEMGAFVLWGLGTARLLWCSEEDTLKT